MLVFAMLFQAPCAFASVKTKSKYTGITYTHASRFDDKDLIYGMDISHHNGKSILKGKKDGIKYVLFVWDTQDIQSRAFRLIMIRNTKHISKTQKSRAYGRCLLVFAG